jgi:hypothetical protein
MGGKVTETRRESFLFPVVEMVLFAEKDHLVCRQGGLDCGDRRVRQVAGKPDIGDLRADAAG